MLIGQSDMQIICAVLSGQKIRRCQICKSAFNLTQIMQRIERRCLQLHLAIAVNLQQGQRLFLPRF